MLFWFVFWPEERIVFEQNACLREFAVQAKVRAFVHMTEDQSIGRNTLIEKEGKDGFDDCALFSVHLNCHSGLAASFSCGLEEGMRGGRKVSLGRDLDEAGVDRSPRPESRSTRQQISAQNRAAASSAFMCQIAAFRTIVSMAMKPRTGDDLHAGSA